MTGYRLHELVLAVIGFALLGTLLTVRTCRSTERLRAERLERAQFAQQVRLAYADGDPARAARDPRERLPGLDVAGGGASGGDGGGGGVRIDVNAADADLLAHLPGIGPARARDIVATRDRMGGFRTVDDLLEVHGIGEKTLERLRPMISVGGAGTAATISVVSGGTTSAGDGAPAPADAVSLRPGVSQQVAGLPRPPPETAAATAPAPSAQQPPAPRAPPAILPTPLVVAPVPPALVPAVQAAPPAAGAAATGRVNINTAGLEELMSLVGIGKVKAEEIIRHRSAHGAFATPADIMNVKGIGEKTYEKNRHRIVVR